MHEASFQASRSDLSMSACDETYGMKTHAAGSSQYPRTARNPKQKFEKRPSNDQFEVVKRPQPSAQTKAIGTFSLLYRRREQFARHAKPQALTALVLLGAQVALEVSRQIDKPNLLKPTCSPQFHGAGLRQGGFAARETE